VSSTRPYFRQLLSGRDFALSDSLAQSMANNVYLLGDLDTRECLVVDPAYAIDEIFQVAEHDDMKIVGALVSHYHPDHIGGSMMGHTIEGLSVLLERCDIPIHVNANEVPWVSRTTGITPDHLVAHDGGETVAVGNLSIDLVHTPGHTPGSQCFMFCGGLVSGDTLFLDGCGRTDLPGSNVEDMYYSLRRIASLPDETVIFPGHRYSEHPYGDLRTIKAHNHVFRPTSVEQWMQWFGSN
jgi:glyoxylase-like metal-dependent hydrolase (beta-lactamase superfamily II)